MAVSTLRTRQAQWRLYYKFCVQYKLTALPATSGTLCLFVAYMASKGFEYSSTLNYLHSLSALHNYQNLAGPPINHFSVMQALAGLKKQRQDRPHKKLPITIEILLFISKNITALPSRTRTAFWAACLIAFFTLLRRSNLFPAKNNKSFLTVGNVIKKDNLYYVAAKQIKTTKFEACKVNLPLPLIPGSNLCPTSAIKRQLASLHSHAAASLFAYISQSGRIKPLTASRFTKYLRKILSMSNYPAQSYSAHSFRRGGATFASSISIPTDCLKAQGQWRSSCYQQYVSRDDAHRLKFAQGMATAISSDVYDA